jgi:hypothetical protein
LTPAPYGYATCRIEFANMRIEPVNEFSPKATAC